MWRLGVFALLGVLGASPALDAGSLAAGAAQLLAAQRHGVIAFSLAYRYEEHGPAHNVDRSASAAVVRDDGATVTMRASGDPAAKPTLVEDDYRLPIDTKYLPEYRFAAGSASCGGCAPGAIAVDFTSLRRDDEHGDGTMWIDGSSQHVVAMHFHPSVLPAHADSGDITVAFGQVLPDLWDVTVTEQRYDGHTFIFHGWGHVEQRQSEYRRLPSVPNDAKPQT